MTLAPVERLTCSTAAKFGRVTNVRRTSPFSKATGYYAAFIALGLFGASMGPTLPYLAQHTGTRLSEISFLFTARAMGYLLGSLISGRLYDRLPGHRVIAGVLLLIAVTRMTRLKQDSALGIIRALERSPEDYQDAVPDELVDGALIFQDDIGHGLQIDIDHGNHVLGRQPLTYGSKTPEIGHENGGPPLFPADF